MKKAKAGDIIKVGRIKRTIKTIIYQDYWRDEWQIEGYDTNDNYFYWKQAFDGGELIEKGE